MFSLISVYHMLIFFGSSLQKSISMQKTNEEKSDELNKPLVQEVPYDPSKFPPDLSLAQEHANAKKIGDPLPGTEHLKCKCCSLPLFHKKLSLFCDTDEYFCLGEGFPLYFQQLRLNMGFVIVLLVTFAIPLMIFNYQGQECEDDYTKFPMFPFCLSINYNISNVTSLQCFNQTNKHLHPKWLKNLTKMNGLEAFPSFKVLYPDCRSAFKSDITELLIQNKDWPSINSSNRELYYQDKNLQDYKSCSFQYHCEGSRGYQQFSLLNNRNNPNQRHIKAYFVLIAVVMSVLYIQFVRIKVDEKMHMIAERLKTCQPFCVELRGLPKQYGKDELRQYIQTLEYKDQNGKNCNYKVELIDIAYSIYIYYANQDRLKSMNLERSRQLYMQAEEKLINPKISIRIKELDVSIEKIKQEIKQQEEEIFSGHYNKCSSIAFVTFSTDYEAETFLNNYETIIHPKLMELFGKLLGKQCLTFKGHKLTAEYPPRPKDVLWKNCGVEGKRKQKIYYSFLEFSTSMVFFGILGLFSFLKKTLKFLNHENFPWISYFTSIISSIINFYTIVIIKPLEINELHSTQSVLDVAICQKLILIYCLNQGIIILISSSILRAKPEKTYDYQIQMKNGLADDLLWIFFLNIFMTGILRYTHIIYTMKVWDRNKLKKNPISLAHRLISQAEANFLFEGQGVDLSNLYAWMIKQLLITAFYFSLVPLSIFCLLFSLIFFYYSEKLLLNTRYAKPGDASDDLNKDNIEWIEWIPFMIQLGSFVIDISFYPDITTGGNLSSEPPQVIFVKFLGFFISIGNILYGRWFYFTYVRKKTKEVKKYKQEAHQFVETYQSKNPITKDLQKKVQVKKIEVEVINENKSQKTISDEQSQVDYQPFVNDDPGNEKISRSPPTQLNDYFDQSEDYYSEMMDENYFNKKELQNSIRHLIISQNVDGGLTSRSQK